MRPMLPQNDPHPSQRAEALDRARDLYRYSFTHIPGFPMSADVPEQDAPSRAWLEQVGEALVTILVNNAKVDRDEARSSRTHPDHHRSRGEIFRSPREALKRVLDEIIQRAMHPAQSGHATYIGQFAHLFQEIHMPWAVSYLINDDANFAHSLLTGPNPLILRRVTREEGLTERFPIEDIYSLVSGEGSSIDRDIDAGLLYLADYSLLEGVPGGQTFGFQKYVSAPLALLKVWITEEGWHELRPVAIQLGPKPGKDRPIFTPRDHWAWVLAKMHVRVANGNLHQAVAHLAHTHLVMEPVALAMFRQLAPSHPVHILLRPHFEGLLEINQQAWKHLLAPGGGVDTVMACQIEASVRLASQAALSWRFNEAMLPRNLAMRGVDSGSPLPSYWYRDDALRLWSAIRDWAGSYLRLYYRDSTDVQTDRELQAWMAEMLSPEAGRMQDIGEEGAFRTLEYLTDAVAHIIFTSSVQHAAVNYPQYELMSYVPKLPLAACSPPPTHKRVGHHHYLKALPPVKIAYAQLQLGYLLASVRTSRLGHYTAEGFLQGLVARMEEGPVQGLLDTARNGWAGYFWDPRVQGPLEAFQNTLAQIEKSIDERNAESVYPYEYLKPSLIPASTNI